MGPSIWQIGTDGGYLDAPVKIDPNVKPLDKLLIMPGERADVIIDFAGLAGTDAGPAQHRPHALSEGCFTYTARLSARSCSSGSARRR